MSLQLQVLRDKIDSARALLSVVETMRGLAYVNMRRAEAVAAQAEAHLRTVHVALHAALTSLDFRTRQRMLRREDETWSGSTTALLIATDMGLCGQFNERVVEYALDLWRRETRTARTDGGGADDDFQWVVVGARGWERLVDAGATIVALLDAPGSVEAVGAAAAEAFVALSRYASEEDRHRLLVVYNAPSDEIIFAPRHVQLAPFQPSRWLAWPEGEPRWKTRPLLSPAPEETLRHLVREQTYIDLFNGFIQSFAAENAARLSSMRNATDNIEELLDELQLRYRRERQDVITNELMEILGGVEAVQNE